MSFDLPLPLRESVAAWLAANAPANMREQTQRLRQTYGAGQSSGAINIAAYLSSRMPATFAAISFVLNEVALVQPDFAPATLLDVGAGPGTASFAAQGLWPQLERYILLEQDARFNAVAKTLAKAMLPQIEVHQQSLLSATPRADVVVAAYVLAELSQEHATKAALHLWQHTDHTLVIVEPGTPSGFARIRSSRDALINASAHIIGPCTHAAACPMQAADWCHFKARLARSRAHMQAKAATVPFEDEAFSWVAVSRREAPLPQARIVGPPTTNKVAVTMRVCDAQGLHDESFASRHKATYNKAKKLKWGASLPMLADQQS